MYILHLALKIYQQTSSLSGRQPSIGSIGQFLLQWCVSNVHHYHYMLKNYTTIKQQQLLLLLVLLQHYGYCNGQSVSWHPQLRAKLSPDICSRRRTHNRHNSTRRWYVRDTIATSTLVLECKNWKMLSEQNFTDQTVLLTATSAFGLARRHTSPLWC